MTKVYKKLGDSTLFRSNKRRAGYVLQKNQMSIARQPWVNRWFLFSTGFHRVSHFRASENLSRQMCSMRWKMHETVGSWSLVGVLSCPALPCLAAMPCAAPPRYACGMTGFRFDKWKSEENENMASASPVIFQRCMNTSLDVRCWLPLECRCAFVKFSHLSNTKPEHTMGGTVRRQVDSPKIQPSLKPPDTRTFLGMSLEERTTEFLCKPTEKQNQGLTRI